MRNLNALMIYSQRRVNLAYRRADDARLKFETNKFSVQGKNVRSQKSWFGLVLGVENKRFPISEGMIWVQRLIGHVGQAIHLYSYNK